AVVGDAGVGERIGHRGRVHVHHPRKLRGNAAERAGSRQLHAGQHLRLLRGGERNREAEAVGVVVRALVEAVDGARVAEA
nr:hypothetical protein [Tanacetum cinerariifolium]